MPSLAHHALVDMFREQPDLAPSVLESALGLPLPPGAACRLGDSNLDELRPAERRADLVLELRREDLTQLVLVLEVQLRIDPRKRLAWLDYLASARRRGRACVCVVTTDPQVAAWAAQPFDLGPGNPEFRVWVLGPEQIEAIVDERAARESPGLTLLSALTHAKSRPETLAAALASLPGLSRELAGLYSTVYGQIQPQTSEAPVMEPTQRDSQTVYQEFRDLLQFIPVRLMNDFVITYYTTGNRAAVPRVVAETVDHARAEIQAKQKAKVHALLAELEEKALAEALQVRSSILLRLLERAGFEPSESQRKRVERCTRVSQLDRWTDRILTASSADEVFGAASIRKNNSAAPKRARR